MRLLHTCMIVLSVSVSHFIPKFRGADTSRACQRHFRKQSNKVDVLADWKWRLVFYIVILLRVAVICSHSHVHYVFKIDLGLHPLPIWRPKPYLLNSDLYPACNLLTLMYWVWGGLCFLLIATIFAAVSFRTFQLICDGSCLFYLHFS